MERKEIISAYQKAIENNNYFEKETPFRKRVKIFLYYIVIILLNDYRPYNCQRVHVINGKMELKFIKSEEYRPIYYGIFKENSLCGVRRTYTFVSNNKKIERIKLLLKAIRSYNRAYGGNLAYWIDFCFLNNFILSSGVKILLSNGHYDRLTSASSFLCETYGIQFYIQQHGLIGWKQDIPCKIYCDKLYAYDKLEIEKFKEKVIGNKNCIYRKRNINNVIFLKSPKTGFTIGVIEQPLKEMRDIIEIILESNPTGRIIVMLHPLSRIEVYKEFTGNKNIEFLHDKREWNLDIMVSSPSTLAYEYLQNGFQMPVFFVDINCIMEDFKGRYDNLIYIDNLQLLRKELRKISEAKITDR